MGRNDIAAGRVKQVKGTLNDIIGPVKVRRTSLLKRAVVASIALALFMTMSGCWWDHDHHHDDRDHHDEHHEDH